MLVCEPSSRRCCDALDVPPNQSLERTRSAAASGFAGSAMLPRRSAPDPLDDIGTLEAERR